MPARRGGRPNEYDSLLASTNRTLDRHDPPLPPRLPARARWSSPTPRTGAGNPEDANWAAPFLFGRWAWDAQLFGARGERARRAAHRRDVRVRIRAASRASCPPDTFGGYPGDYYSTGYNAGYGSGGLASTRYRDQGILSYEFMIAHTQSGPYSWWESASAPPTTSPWIGSHPAAGRGLLAARVGHREREQGPARLARRPGVATAR